MPQETIAVGHAVWDGMKFLLAGAVALVGFNLKRAHDRIDQKADKEVLEKAVTRIEKSIIDGRKENRDDHKELHQRIDEMRSQ